MLSKKRGILTRRILVGLIGCAGVAGAVTFSGALPAETPKGTDAGMEKATAAAKRVWIQFY